MKMSIFRFSMCARKLNPKKHNCKLIVTFSVDRTPVATCRIPDKVSKVSNMASLSSWESKEPTRDTYRVRPQ